MDMPLEFEVPDIFMIPTTMVFTYPAGGGQAKTRRHGAPLSMRIFYDVLTALPHDGRRGQGKWRLEFTLRDLRAWLYPSVEGRPTSFKMRRHLERIRAALWEVGNMRIERTLPGDAVPSLWLPIAVRAMPVPDLDSPVVLISSAAGKLRRRTYGPSINAPLRTCMRTTALGFAGTRVFLGQVWDIQRMANIGDAP